MFVILAP